MAPFADKPIKRARVTVDLPPEVIRELRIEAAERGKRIGDVILEALLTRTRLVQK